MPHKNKIDLKSLILSLLEKQEIISLKDIAAAAGMNVKRRSVAERRAIQRALSKLISTHAVISVGQARARVYKKYDTLSQKEEGMFRDIILAEDSQKLLQYLSKPIHQRQPVGYNQNFLRLYQPNHTFYLSADLRKELLAAGRVENVVRPAGTYARNILNRLLIDLSWNSSRLEGNTYSLLETKRLIELGESAEGKDALEAQMILNHKYAIEYIIESANEPKISSHEICSIHALLSENLLGDPSASGRLRYISVGISGSTYYPLENPHVLKECFDLLIKKMNQIKDPFEQSFFAIIHLSYLQAFDDVNKRTARLTANIPLIKQNLKPLSFIGVSQKDYVMSLLGIYEKNDISLMRDLYVWAYKISAQRYTAIQQSMGVPNVFKFKYHNVIHEIVRTIIVKNIPRQKIVLTIRKLIAKFHIQASDANRLFEIIETELVSLHEGNIARFKIRPSEFEQWKRSNK